MCHISHVTCQVSDVICHFFVQSGEASRGRVCYQQGLPHLVIRAPEVIDRPGVAGAFLQTASSLIH